MENVLKNREWKEFTVESLFFIKIGKNVDGNKINKNSGKVAYITRKETNNGLDGFLNYEEIYLNKTYPVITIGNETAEPFVQTYQFYTGTKVNILKPKVEISKYALLFISQCIKVHKAKYSYSMTINSTRLKKQIILLPINSMGTPDYVFMEEYMRAKEQEKIVAYEKYIENRLAKLQNVKGIAPFSEKEWGEFKIGKLFTLYQGKSKGLNHLEKNINGISYLGATNNNNGVLTFVKKIDKLVQKGNCIAFIRNGEGSMGFSIYKEEDFIATSDISVGYNEYLNKYNGLFITTIADKIRGKYNFGYKRNETRLSKETIQLPVNSSGTPDYEYMEQFMRKKEQESLLRYLEYIENQTFVI